MGEQMYT